jgi:hypothetical protein
MLLVLWLLGKVLECVLVRFPISSRHTDPEHFAWLDLCFHLISPLSWKVLSLTSSNMVRTPTSPRPRALRSQPWINCPYAQCRRVVVRVFRVIGMESIRKQVCNRCSLSGGGCC